MLEALALDIPILSLKSPGGVLEIMLEGENGYFFNEENFEEKIKEILTINRVKIINTIKKYNIYDVIKKYEELFLGKNY